MHEWTDFLVAIAGASAALVGLLFVGLSINLKKIISIKHLPSRALTAILMLSTVLIVSLMELIPGQNSVALGCEVLGVGLFNWLSELKCLWIGFKHVQAKWGSRYDRAYAFNLFLNQLATLPYLIAGVLFCLNNPTAPYWLVPGFLISIALAISDAWVLLIEINR